MKVPKSLEKENITKPINMEACQITKIKQEEERSKVYTNLKKIKMTEVCLITDNIECKLIKFPN